MIGGLLPQRADWAADDFARLSASLVVVLVIAACSAPNPQGTPVSTGASVSSRNPTTGSGPNSGSTARVDACHLLPAAEVSKIVGGDARANAMPSVGWIAGQCAWSTATSGFFISIGTPASLREAPNAAAPDAKAKLEEFRRQMSAIGPSNNVAGIGDGAVVGKAAVAAYDGGTYLEITKLQLTDEQLLKLLKLAVANISAAGAPTGWSDRVDVPT